MERRLAGSGDATWRAAMLAAGLLLLAACGGGGSSQGTRPLAPRALPVPPPLPDTTGWGVPVLSMAQNDEGELWLGTNGFGIRVIRPRAPRERTDTAADTTAAAAPGRPPASPWEAIVAGGQGAIGSNHVTAIALTADGTIWYGTPGSGFGRSSDGGRTWRNWGGEELDGYGLSTALNGIRAAGDTVYIATTDGLRITRDGGTRWTCVVGRDPWPAPATGESRCDEIVRGLPNPYLLAVAADGFGRIWAGGLGGLALSRDGGRSWETVPAGDGAPAGRVRAIAMNTDSTLWVATETAVHVDSARRRDRYSFREANLRTPGFPRLPGSVRAVIPSPGRLPPTFALSYGMATGDGETREFRLYYLSAADRFRPVGDLWTVIWRGPPAWPVAGATTGLNTTLAGDFETSSAIGAPRAADPSDPPRPWLARPIVGDDANPYVDAIRPFGTREVSGVIQTGSRFNNPEGTSVHAVAAGEVVFAGEDAAGSQTVAIRHDGGADGRTVFSSYHGNSRIEVAVGERVRPGQRIGAVGRTGDTDGSRLDLRIHVASADDIGEVLGGGFAVNPQLWIEPLPGTGVVAGRVLDASGEPIDGATIHGLVLPYPTETPFTRAVSYAAGVSSDPRFGEHFTVGDVPAGEYMLGVMIGEERVWRRVRVQAGRITTVEFRAGG